jgi:hypothetical protein
MKEPVRYPGSLIARPHGHTVVTAPSLQVSWAWMDGPMGRCPRHRGVGQHSAGGGDSTPTPRIMAIMACRCGVRTLRRST